MGYTYYQIMYMIPSDVDYTFDGLVQVIRGMFGERGLIHINPEKRRIIIPITRPTLTGDDEETWSYYLVWNDASYVIEEAKEFAEDFAQNDPSRAHRIASCRQRIEGHGDPDPKMGEGFFFYVYIHETLDKWLKGCYMIDAYKGKLMDAGSMTS